VSAERVIAALRADLQVIVTELSIQPEANMQLTVDQVAQRLGVSRSTVYALARS
jgi:DNA-binding MurR/RpiR family transcriptional regulator